jgi:hypothetical protein
MTGILNPIADFSDERLPPHEAHARSGRAAKVIDAAEAETIQRHAPGSDPRFGDNPVEWSVRRKSAMTTNASTQTATEWLKQRYQDIELEIEDRATTDGRFAIAHALLRLTEVLDDRLDAVAEAINNPLDSGGDATADAIDRLGGGGPLDRLAGAAEALVEAIESLKSLKVWHETRKTRPRQER